MGLLQQRSHKMRSIICQKYKQFYRLLRIWGFKRSSTYFDLVHYTVVINKVMVEVEFGKTWVRMSYFYNGICNTKPIYIKCPFGHTDITSQENDFIEHFRWMIQDTK